MISIIEPLLNCHDRNSTLVSFYFKECENEVVVNNNIQYYFASIQTFSDILLFAIFSCLIITVASFS